MRNLKLLLIFFIKLNLSLNIYAQTPKIISFTPLGKCGDSSVTIYIHGKNLNEVDAMHIGKKKIDSFSVNSSTEIAAKIKKNNFGKITISNRYGKFTSAEYFQNTNAYIPYLYVTTMLGKSISVINTNTCKVDATINIGSYPNSFVASRDGSKLYISSQLKNTVSIINTATNLITKELEVGNGPISVDLSPDGMKVYVVNFKGNSVSVINTKTDILDTTIKLENQPYSLAITPDGKKIYITSWQRNTISVFNTANYHLEATITIGRDLFANCYIEMSDDGNQAYVVNNYYYSNEISVINTKTNALESISCDKHPRGFSISPDGNTAYLTHSQENLLSVIDTKSNKVIKTINDYSLFGAGMIVLKRDNQKGYILNESGHSVIVMNTVTNKLVKTIKLNGDPHFFLLSKDGTKLFVFLSTNNTISVIETVNDTILTNIQIDKWPSIGYLLDVPSPCFTNNLPKEK